MELKKVNKKVLKGVVKSNAMTKTIVVRIDRSILHPLYKKYVKKSKSFKVHDEKNLCNVGDVVRIIECRPLSKEKRFRLLEILKKN